MDAAQALSELTALSAQITSAIVVDADGSPVASTLDEESARELAQTVQELLAAAGRAGDGRQVAQLEVATPEGSVFLVREGERADRSHDPPGAGGRPRLLRPEVVPARHRRPGEAQAEGPEEGRCHGVRP